MTKFKSVFVMTMALAGALTLSACDEIEDRNKSRSTTSTAQVEQPATDTPDVSQDDGMIGLAINPVTGSVGIDLGGGMMLDMTTGGLAFGVGF